MKKLLVMVAACLIGMAPIEMSAKQNQDDETTSKAKGKRGEKMTAAQMAEQRAKQMTKQYSLTEAQQKQLVTLFTEQMNNGPMRGRKEGGFKQMTEAQRDSTQKAMKAQREKFEASLKKILTTEQYTQYVKDEKARMEKRRERMQERREQNSSQDE